MISRLGPTFVQFASGSGRYGAQAWLLVQRDGGRRRHRRAGRPRRRPARPA